MIAYDVQVNGLDILQVKLFRAPQTVKHEAVIATNKSVVGYQGTAREIAPKDRSPMVNSIAISPANVEGTKGTGSVGTDLSYSPAQEPVLVFTAQPANQFDQNAPRCLLGRKTAPGISPSQ